MLKDENGKWINIAPWFTHDDLIKGGTLKLEMGPFPNKKWGRKGDIDTLLNHQK